MKGRSMNEVWKEVQGYPDYFVSDLGRVRSLKKGVFRILNPMNNHGYKCVSLCQNGHVKIFLVHRLVANAFIPNPGNLPIINHKDENPSNNAVVNLEWCDNRYNINYGSCRRKISEANKGRHHSDETRRKMSESHLGEKNWFFGKKHSEQTKMKISKALSGKRNPNFGKHFSLDHRRKLSESHKRVAKVFGA